MTIPQDKIDHFVYGIAMDAVLRPLAGYFEAPAFVSRLVVVACVAVIAICKEWWDSRGHGTPEALDALATVLGCLCLEVWCEILSEVPL